MTDKKLSELEAGTKALESEKNFDKAIELFKKNAQLVRELLADLTDKKGQITQIINGIEELFDDEE